MSSPSSNLREIHADNVYPSYNYLIRECVVTADFQKDKMHFKKGMVGHTLKEWEQRRIIEGKLYVYRHNVLVRVIGVTGETGTWMGMDQVDIKEEVKQTEQKDEVEKTGKLLEKMRLEGGANITWTWEGKGVEKRDLVEETGRRLGQMNLENGW